MEPRRWLQLVLVTSGLAQGCSAPAPPGDATTDARGADATTADTEGSLDARLPDGAPAPTDVVAPTDSMTPGDGAAPSCEPFGRFGEARTTFTLPGPAADGGLYVPDVQARFPMVDWANLDRLYIPAGTYQFINLGNLPNRTPERPLVITNLGGQVHLLATPGTRLGYIWAINGGSNWVVTGRYDPMSRTGDVNFPGHRCGEYAGSRGRYGFLSDDAFAGSGHMGIGIGGAEGVELEFIEITRSGFAGVRVNRRDADGTTGPLANYRIHDLYIHDIKSEAIYFGWTGAAPSPLSERLQIYNNRILRTGTEALQVQNLGDGTEIHHNVIAWGALDWRAAFGMFQDGNTQVQVRRGNIRFHHNVFMGGAGSFLSFFASNETGDGNRTVLFEDNYFADTLSLGGYLGGTTGADSSYTFRRNTFRGLDFGYTAVYPDSTEPTTVFGVGAMFTSPVLFEQNTWEGSRRLLPGITGGMGMSRNLTATGNTNAAVDPIAFVNSGYPAGAPTRRLEMWTARATLAPGMPEVRYEMGALVMHDGEMYEAIAANTNQVPPMSPSSWRRLPLPADDVRTAPSSPYAARGIGLSDRAP